MIVNILKKSLRRWYTTDGVLSSWNKTEKFLIKLVQHQIENVSSWKPRGLSSTTAPFWIDPMKKRQPVITLSFTCATPMHNRKLTINQVGNKGLLNAHVFKRSGLLLYIDYTPYGVFWIPATYLFHVCVSLKCSARLLQNLSRGSRKGNLHYC